MALTLLTLKSAAVAPQNQPRFWVVINIVQDCLYVSTTGTWVTLNVHHSEASIGPKACSPMQTKQVVLKRLQCIQGYGTLLEFDSAN